MITKVAMKKVDGKFHLEAKNESGNSVHIDAGVAIGGENKGIRPMELLLMSLGGCSSIDVLLILNKQKIDPIDFHIEIEGNREEGVEPSLYRDIKIKYWCKGEMSSEKLKRAVALSLEKYCSVAKTLEPTAKITTEIYLNNQLV